MPSCFDCYYNIGFAYSQKKDWPKAEEAFKKAIEFKPDYVEAYNGLAQIYNAQKKFDEAQAASQKAAELAMAAGAAGGAGGVDALYNVGRHRLERGQGRGGEEGLRGSAQARPEARRTRTTSWRCATSTSASCPRPSRSSRRTSQNAPDGQYAAQVKAMLTQLKK